MREKTLKTDQIVLADFDPSDYLPTDKDRYDSAKQRLESIEYKPKASAWLPWQIEILKDFYGTVPVKEVAKAVGHPVKSTMKMAAELGIKSKICSKNW